jgi:hypothetical protein
MISAPCLALRRRSGRTRAARRRTQVKQRSPGVFHRCIVADIVTNADEIISCFSPNHDSINIDDSKN